MSQNSSVGFLHNKLPLSPAERSRLYRRGLRPRMQSLPITISDERIRALVKQGYLGLNELNDMRAVEQAMNLFVWNELEEPLQV